MRNVILSLLLVVLLISGCTSRVNFSSYCGPLPKTEAITAIALDAVNYLTTSYPPGFTAIHLKPAKDAQNIFAQTFENSLRSKGFKVIEAERAEVITIAYALDVLSENTDGNTWYLELRITDLEKGRYVVAREYTQEGQPVASQSRRVLGRDIIGVSRKAHG